MDKIYNCTKYTITLQYNIQVVCYGNTISHLHGIKHNIGHSGHKHKYCTQKLIVRYLIYYIYDFFLVVNTNRCNEVICESAVVKLHDDTCFSNCRVPYRKQSNILGFIATLSFMFRRHTGKMIDYLLIIKLRFTDAKTFDIKSSWSEMSCRNTKDNVTFLKNNYV